jgi:hypothetical protein
VESANLSMVERQFRQPRSRREAERDGGCHAQWGRR